MSNPLDAMLGDAPAMAEEVVSTPVAEAIPPQAPEAAAEAPQSPPERPRGPDGKFAKAEAETPPTATPAPPAEPAAKDPLPGISAMLDEREKRQAAQARADAAEAKAKALEERLNAQSQGDQPPPTWEAEMQRRLHEQAMDNSRRWAIREHGKETAEAAFNWAMERCEPTSPQFDPAFNSMIAAQLAQRNDPYEVAVQAYTRDKIVSRVTPDRLAAFEAWEAAQAGLAAQPHTFAPPQSPAPPTPPRSLAHAPGNGALGRDSPVEVAPGAAFASTIN